MVPKSLTALLKDAIDYAGLFPPAKLPMEEAIDSYETLINGERAWIVDRLVIPANRLTEAEKYFEQWEVEPNITATGRITHNDADFRQVVVEDIEAIQSFEYGTVLAFECRVPEPLLADPERLNEVLLDLPPQNEELEWYAELPFTENWQKEIPDAIVAVHGSEGVMAKIRTGGTEASAFLSVEQLSLWIAECSMHRQPFKATAGLHHPIRKHDAEIGTKMHGFLNLFCAVTLARKHHLDAESIAKIIELETPSAFDFQDNGFSVLGMTADLHDIENCRWLLKSFGSCSVDEPIEDLKSLGYAFA